MLWAWAAGTAAVSGFLSAKNAKDDREAHNKQIAGHQALLRRRIANIKKAHEITAYGKYVDNASSGAERIGNALAAGGFASNASIINQVKDMAFRVDLALGDKATEIKIDNLEQEIKNVGMAKAEGSRGLDFLSGALKGGLPYVPSLIKKYGNN